MKFLRLTALACFASLFCLAARAEKERVPFIERIGVKDYLTVQAMFPEAYSRTNDMVVLQTVDGLQYRALIMKKDRAGKHFVELWSLDDSLPVEPVEMAPEIARQVLRAFELKLYRFVLMGTGVHVAKGRPEAWWFFHRNRDNMASAGLVIQPAMHDNPDADLLVKDLIGGLVSFASAPESERIDLQGAVDRAATEIILRDSP